MKNNNQFENLINEILEKTSAPEDHYEIAALLESFGWNDDRAEEAFGVDDVFELAENIWDTIQKRISAVSIAPIEKAGFLKNALVLIKSFIRGVIFALPMMISVVSMLLLRFSLWSYEYLSLELATCIAIATILSFMTVGGFTQAIARRGYFYITQSYYNMARRMTFYFVKSGYVVATLLMLIFFLFNLIFAIFPPRMIIVIAVYYFFLSAIWLSITVMYILQKELVFTGLLSFGIGIVYILFTIFKIDIIVAQIISLFIVAVLGMILVIYFFHEAEKKEEKGISPALPRKSITLYSIMPYFIYGFLYFTFLFTDRIVAWSTNDTGYMPYIIWFRGAYELGLDFALLTLIFPMGISEVVINRFMMHLEFNLKNVMSYDYKSFNNLYLRMYYRNYIFAIIVSILSGIATYYIITYLYNYLPILKEKMIFTNQTVTFVFIVALIAYSIIAAALLNTVMMFSLSQPEMATKSIIIALIVDYVVGFLLSRWVHYSWAVFGLLAGAIVFMIISTYYMIKILKSLDYYVYASS